MKSRGKMIMWGRWGTGSRELLSREGSNSATMAKGTRGIQNDAFRVPTKHIAILYPYDKGKIFSLTNGILYGRLTRFISKGDDAFNSGPARYTCLSGYLVGDTSCTRGLICMSLVSRFAWFWRCFYLSFIF